ncbi:MAG: Ca2+-transporting ATPase [Elusimicrobia bacterium]|nr:MAG: Ca2+-transporting ATPase [Elusimicrobiota bacterium]KAF0155955.1 MAG: Ca2+-transporting ATPase [Elusimicrobiota bacterium]
MTEEKKAAPETTWHALEEAELYKRLESGKTGLTAEQARQRLESTGPNSLEEGDTVSPFRLLLRQFNNPLIYLLLGAAALSFSIGHRIDSGVILGVVLLNTLLGFFQEWRAEGALKALRKMAAQHARVLRDGKPADIEASEVVPGDVLLLETGSRVAADARVISGDNLHTDESALTGESLPVPKKAETQAEDIPMADRKGVVWMSTGVTGGRGKAIVVETGMRTVMGRIAGEVSSTSRESTPLQKRMHKLGIVLGVLGLSLATGIFFLGLLRGHTWTEMLMFSVAVAVSAIPEGLPAVISVTLALGVRRMAQRNAIIRRMSAVETLGSTTVICSDKTGTITENQMTVRRLWAGGRSFEVTGDGYKPEGEIRPEEGTAAGDRPVELDKLLWIGAVSTNAALREEEGRWLVDGNPSEGALLTAAVKAGMDIAPLQKEGMRLAELPFSSEAKYNATLHPDGGGSGRVACVKGASERITGFCSHIMKDGQRVELTEELRRGLTEVNEKYASGALRVMAGAWKEMPEGTSGLKAEDAENGMTLAGFWGMFDPPRKETVQAVKDAKGAGIRPVMITGDHAVTALAIAQQVGITEKGPAVTGAEMEKMEKPELARIALERGVFARVSPAHKLKLMEALKEQGHIVAMTGDGVNDAPALKGADIGIAMGRAGTEVAKEAADMILTDDNFATIVKAVEEGRVIYSNLRRVVFFLLTTNLGEVLMLGTALLIGLDLPLTAVMILWVNLVTDGVSTVPLGVEPGHSNVLRHPPRDPKAFIVDRRMALRMALLMPFMAAGTLGLFWHARQSGGLDYARTVAFTTLAAFQWFQAFNARSNHQSIFSIGFFGNRWLLVGVGTAIVLQIGAVHTPLGHMLLGTVSMSVMDWARIMLVASSIFWADELFKRLGVYGDKNKGD